VILEPQSTLKRPPDGRLIVDYENARHGLNDRAIA
jgi:hypothetical protein